VTDQKQGGILGLVTARGGSKGIPQKNIMPVAGKPMISWTIMAALGAQKLTRTIVSTDDEHIAKVAREAGADVPFVRPAELAADDTPHMDVIEHALQWMETHEKWKPDYLLLLQPTSPLRNSADIDAVIDVAMNDDLDSVVSVCESPAHPYWMKKIDASGRLQAFLPEVDMGTHRQQLPKVYVVNGAIYMARRELLLKRGTFYTDRTFGYVMPPDRSIDIDEMADLRRVEEILIPKPSCA
jgi:CMP-N,N'-diacetyllegionaminic acid synthase